jgi:hypothetical protein
MGCICSAFTPANPGCPQHGDGGAPINALGERSPGRTDFSRWSRENLERFARNAADENLLLRRALTDAGIAMPGGL